MNCMSRRPGTRAFTLIEVMVAMVIFAIIMTALFASFRTGMRAYELGTKHGEQQQVGRYAVTQIGEDLRNIFYLPESRYNVTRRQREALLDEQEALGIQSGGTDEAIDENLPEMGPPIDLSFQGEDGDEQDRLSFVRRETSDNPENRMLWGLSRVTYYIVDKALYRAVDDVTKPETDADGNPIPKPFPPRVDKLSSNCIGFDLKYGYYHEEAFELAEAWDSNASQYRNPPSEEDDDITDASGNSVNSATAEGQAAQLQQGQEQQLEQQQRADELPGWIELTFKFATSDKEDAKPREYRQTIMMYNKYSVETYVPEDDLDDKSAGGSQRRSRKT